MKIAIPTQGRQVDDHFGHCEAYTVFTVGDDKQITAQETLPSPQGCGCKSNIASTLKEQGVSIMLAGNMGEGALKKLSSQGIQVVRGCSGNIDEVIAAYLSGSISDSGMGCRGHGEDHQCSHGHKHQHKHMHGHNH